MLEEGVSDTVNVSEAASVSAKVGVPVSLGVVLGATGLSEKKSYLR